ncbi:MAG: putative zinc metalloprotease Rip3 [Actinobacteria bacterium ADurb.Bin346]|nr:MAG: putative zinc metalloprotease Rip3 [Actinobacteria bacterium ADurb.Bin346]
MFKTSLKLFKIAGIEIRLDYSWFLIFAILAYYFGFSYFPKLLPELNSGIIAAITIITVLLFFFSVLAHELSHSLIAKSKGMGVNRISLWIFGGMAEIEKEPDTPFKEFIMSIAGPVTSFVIAFIFGVVWYFTRNFAPVGEPAAYLAQINIILGVFNLLPGYPLDGGRVLRSIIWKVTGSLKRATFIASTTGRVFGFILIAAGIVFIFTGNFLNGIWFALIGWFLQSAAYMSYRQLIFETSVKGIKVKDIIGEEIVTVSQETTLQELVDEYFMKYRFSRFPVTAGVHTRKILGVISIHDIKAFPKEELDTITVGEIVKSISSNEIIPEDMEVSEAIKQMTKLNLGHLIVMSGNRLKGMLTKTDVMNYIQFYSELH